MLYLLWIVNIYLLLIVLISIVNLYLNVRWNYYKKSEKINLKFSYNICVIFKNIIKCISILLKKLIKSIIQTNFYNYHILFMKLINF